MSSGSGVLPLSASTTLPSSSQTPLSQRCRWKPGNRRAADVVAAANVGERFLAPFAALDRRAIPTVTTSIGSCSIGRLRPSVLSGTAAAGGIAMINAVGNLGGFLGPYMVGFIKDATGSFSVGLLVISMGALIGAVVLLALGHDRRLEQAPEVQEHLRSA